MPLIAARSPLTPRSRRGYLRALLRTVCLYGLAGSAYTAAVAVFRPAALGQRVWRGSQWPHRDTFGAVAFALSFLACLILQLSGEGLVR